MAKWSWTKLSAARRCLLRPVLEADKDCPKRIPEFLNAGRDNHTVLEIAAVRARLAVPPLPLEVVADEMREEWKTNGLWKHADPKIFDKIEDTLSGVAIPEQGEHLILEPKYQVDALGNLEEEDCKREDAYCSGLVDYAVYGKHRLYIRDWKTGWGDGAFDDMDQIILYAGMMLAWMRDESIMMPNVVDLGIVHPFKPSADVEIVMDVPMVLARYAEILAEMRSMDYIFDSPDKPEGSFGAHCANCFVSVGCPLYLSRVKSPSVWETDEESWAMLAVLKGEVKHIEEHLRKRLASDERIDVGLKSPLRFDEVQVTGYDAAKAWPVLKENGVTTAMYLQHLSLTKTALNKLIKDKEVFAEVHRHASFSKKPRKSLTTKPEKECEK